MTLRDINFRSILIALSFLAVGVAAAVSSADGPYVLHDAQGQWVAQQVTPGDTGSQVERKPIGIGQQVTVPAVGALPAFKARLRPPAAMASDTVSVPPTAPLFVIADTHGEFEILVELLQKQRIVNRKLRWSFGRGHLVFLGDVFDRGPHQTEILWLIYQLEAEASKAGGGVHLLLGNHEAMVLRGDVRYLNPKYLETAKALEVESYAGLFGPQTLLGQWLRSKPAVFKLNNLLLLHGGISSEVVAQGLTLAQLNAVVRGTLNDDLPTPEDRARSEFAMGPSGPLWYRGYFANESRPALASADDIDRIREHFDVGTILVGHTKVPTVTPLYEGKVIAVQVYPRRDEETGKAIMEAVLLEDGTWYRVKIDGTREPLALARPESTIDAGTIPGQREPSS